MHRRHRISTLAGSILAAAALAGAGAGGASAEVANSYPVTPNFLAGALGSTADPAAPPPGANVAGCRASTRHPYPVVLINGTFANQQDSFGALAPIFANGGYCVYTFAYGAPANDVIQSIGAVATSAQTLAAEVDNVRHLTGAGKVDLVGWSQGGLLAEYYAKVLGGAHHIHDLVGLSATTHGTTLDGLLALASAVPGANAFLGAACQACVDQESTSSTVKVLDRGPIAQAGVNYTIIETLNETVVTPVGSSFINEPGVANEYVQSFCPFDPVDHVDLTYDRVVIQLVEDALDPTTAQRPDCFTEFPFPA